MLTWPNSHVHPWDLGIHRCEFTGVISETRGSFGILPVPYFPGLSFKPLLHLNKAHSSRNNSPAKGKATVDVQKPPGYPTSEPKPPKKPEPSSSN